MSPNRREYREWLEMAVKKGASAAAKKGTSLWVGNAERARSTDNFGQVILRPPFSIQVVQNVLARQECFCGRKSSIFHNSNHSLSGSQRFLLCEPCFSVPLFAIRLLVAIAD